MPHHFQRAGKTSRPSCLQVSSSFWGAALLLNRAGEPQLSRQDKSYFGKELSCCQGFDFLNQNKMGQNKEELAQSKTSYPEIGEVFLPKGIDLHPRASKRPAVKITPGFGKEGVT